MRCRACGHARECHAWGTGPCVTVMPAWVCPAKCRRYVP